MLWICPQCGTRNSNARCYGCSAMNSRQPEIDSLRALLSETGSALQVLWDACAAPGWGGDLTLNRYRDAANKTKAALARFREVKRDHKRIEANHREVKRDG